jgi:nucleoside-diphosphate-sugar epimerase
VVGTGTYEHETICTRGPHMKVLITGAAGFVGASIARHLARHGHKIVALDARPASDLTRKFWGNANPHIDVRVSDVTQSPTFDELDVGEPFDAIVHGAALTPAPAEELDAALPVVSVNVIGTVSALKWAVAQPLLRRFVFLSSTNVYGALTGVDLPEDTPLHPATLFGITKLTCEQIIQRFHQVHDLPTVSVRITSVYGAAEQVTPSRKNLSFFCQCMQKAFQNVPVALPDPHITHDWIYAEDLARAVVTLLTADHLQWPVYNVCSGRQVSAETILQAFQAEVPDFQWMVVAPEHANVVFPSSGRRPVPTRLQDELGFQCNYDLRAGLHDYLAECTSLYSEDGQ